jgi:Tryptophan-associated transmembrane protein (Trp_oprn_chp)
VDDRSSEPRSSVLASRTAGFVAASVGALLMGGGATATWITVGIPNESAHTAIRGTDLIDGVIVLLCAIVTLAGVVATRIVGSRNARQALGALVAIAGLVAGAIGAAFLVDGKDREAMIKALGIPRDLWSQFGAFRNLGPGPYLVVLGGLIGIVGGVLTMAWAHNDPEPQDPGIA